jgi:hypothetical protein
LFSFVFILFYYYFFYFICWLTLKEEDNRRDPYAGHPLASPPPAHHRHTRELPLFFLKTQAAAHHHFKSLIHPKHHPRPFFSSLKLSTKAALLHHKYPQTCKSEISPSPPSQTKATVHIINQHPCKHKITNPSIARDHTNLQIQKCTAINQILHCLTRTRPPSPSAKLNQLTAIKLSAVDPRCPDLETVSTPHRYCRLHPDQATQQLCHHRCTSPAPTPTSAISLPARAEERKKHKEAVEKLGRMGRRNEERD